MPKLIEIAGQHPGSVDVLIDVVGEDAVALAAAETRDRRPDVALHCNDPITPDAPADPRTRRDRELRELDRLMRQRSTGELGSAV